MRTLKNHGEKKNEHTCQHMCQRTDIQNHEYANRSRHTYVRDICQLFNPAEGYARLKMCQCLCLLYIVFFIAFLFILNPSIDCNLSLALWLAFSENDIFFCPKICWSKNFINFQFLKFSVFQFVLFFITLLVFQFFLFSICWNQFFLPGRE